MPSRPFNPAEAISSAVDLHRRGELREAEKLYTRVLKAAPDHFDALHLLGLVKAQSGQAGEAFRLMSKALKINPRAPDAWANYANVLHALKRDAEALDALDKALALKPGDPDILHSRGTALLTLNRPQEALASFEQVLALNPRHVNALINRGAANAALGKTREAIADFETSLALAPGHPGALYNLANALLESERPDDALTAFDRALAGAPNHAQAWNNRGRALQALNRHRDAVASFDRAIALQKNYGDAHSNRALSLLSLGDYAQGFAEYEWRWKRSGMSDVQRGHHGALWLGEYPLARKTILLSAEQGLGDTIQFARYAPLIAATGATVRLDVQAPLKELLTGLAGVASVHARGEPLPKVDVYCPFGSLPLALKTTPAEVPADLPYLQADPQRLAKWRPVIEPLPGRRVALVWAGNPAHPNDRNRSMALETLEPLLAVDGVSFVSLQRDLRGGDEERLKSHPRVSHIGADLADMADAAAVLALSDLLITVDTAAAHLSLAMARPTWVALPFAPDWRWESETGQSLWYPQARLFRQARLGDWAGVVSSLREALVRFAREQA